MPQPLINKAELSPSQANSSYRPDIDGMRAVAVLGVIFCHAGNKIMTGGFLGVDIFFVISGFLITSIISKDLEQGAFSFANFYVRRIKRLVPALSVMLLVTFTLGWLLLTPDNLQSLAAATLAAVGYVANLYFIRNRGYFEPSAQLDPLLHTWSLGVEEQFYLLWPCLLWCVYRWRCRQRTLILATFVALALSFAGANLALLSKHPFVPRLGYFSLPTRAWELLLGAWTAFGLGYYRGRHKHWFSVSGLGLILYAFANLHDAALVPGAHALLPAIGTTLLLLSGTQAGLANRLLANRCLVTLGLMSYSLYLWHWPVFAYLRYVFGGADLPREVIVAGLGVVFTLSWLSWKYIEMPLRAKNYSLREAFSIWALAPLTVACVLFLGVALTQGAEFRYQDTGKLTQQFLFLDAKYCHDRINSSCSFGLPGKEPSVLMFGDSNAAQFTPFWDNLARELGLGINIRTVSSCYPLLNSRNDLPANDPSLYRPLECKQQIENISKQINRYDIIILAGAWRNYILLPRVPETFDFIEEFKATLKFLGAHHKKAIVIAQLPGFSAGDISSWLNTEYIPYAPLRNLVKWLRGPIAFDRDQSIRTVNAEIKKVVTAYPDAYFFNVADLLERQRRLLPGDSHSLLYKDAGHINQQASNLLAAKLIDAYKSGALEKDAALLLDSLKAE